MRQVRCGAERATALPGKLPPPQHLKREAPASVQPAEGELSSSPGRRRKSSAGPNLQREAWCWALANRAGDGSLPSGKEIARRYSRHERWGRLVKRTGLSGELGTSNESRLSGVRTEHP